MGFITCCCACEVMFKGKLNLCAVKKYIREMFSSSLSPFFFPHIASTQKTKSKKRNNDFLEKIRVFLVMSSQPSLSNIPWHCFFCSSSGCPECCVGCSLKIPSLSCDLESQVWRYFKKMLKF